jgi:hypothetical protein
VLGGELGLRGGARCWPPDVVGRRLHEFGLPRGGAFAARQVEIGQRKIRLEPRVALSKVARETPSACACGQVPPAASGSWIGRRGRNGRRHQQAIGGSCCFKSTHDRSRFRDAAKSSGAGRSAHRNDSSCGR